MQSQVTIFEMLFLLGDFVGRSAHMPYKAVLNGSADFQVHMPDNVVLKDPSSYGLETLNIILEEGIRLSRRYGVITLV